MILEMQMWHLDSILLHITAHDQIIPLSEMRRFTGVSEILTQLSVIRHSMIFEATVRQILQVTTTSLSVRLPEDDSLLEVGIYLSDVRQHQAYDMERLIMSSTLEM